MPGPAMLLIAVCRVLSMVTSPGPIETVQQPPGRCVSAIRSSNRTRQSWITGSALPEGHSTTASGQAQLRGPSGGCGAASRLAGCTVSGVPGRNAIIQNDPGAMAVPPGTVPPGTVSVTVTPVEALATGSTSSSAPPVAPIAPPPCQMRTNSGSGLVR